MARGRMLNASIAKDKQLNALSIEAEYIYLKAIPHLDRDGLINGDPTLLWSDICPRRKELMPKMQSLIDEIVASGLVISYYCDKVEDTVLYFVGFRKNNMAMRYEREAPSRFSLPPGYRHTPTGLSNTDSDDDEQDPGDAGSDQDNDGQSPDKVPTKSRPNPREDQDQDQDQGEYNAPAQPEPTVQAKTPPPSSPTGDPFMDAAAARLNGNGYKSRQRATIDGLQAKLKKLDIEPAQFTAMVNAHLSAKGTLNLANGDSDAADRELSTAQQFVLELCSAGKRFWSPEGVNLVWQSWQTNDGRPHPSEHQLLQHANQMVAGKVSTSARVANGKTSLQPNRVGVGVVIGGAEKLR